MNSDTFLILAAIMAGFAILYLLILKKLSTIQENQQDSTLIEWLKSMQDSLASQNKNITSTLQESYGQLHQRLEKTTQVMADLKKEAGAFSEIGRSMHQLQEFLESPKLRGNIGEEVLKDLITQMFPKSAFHLQYTFKSGAIVDAAIKTSAGILPIDSKFPMENFQKMAEAETEEEKKRYEKVFIKDVRKHIRDISKKYVLPDEETLDFALMYLPSESIYYEIVNHPDTLEYARKRRVYPVSPTTLYASLQTIMLSFQGQKIEARSKKVLQLLRGMRKDYSQLEDTFSTLNRHVTNAYNQTNNAGQDLNKLGQKINSAQSLQSSQDSLLEE